MKKFISFARYARAAYKDKGKRRESVFNRIYCEIRHVFKAKTTTQMEKIELIKKLTDLHPGTIPEKYKHYGRYVGGMRDTGEWYFRVLLDEPIENLQECLDLMTPKSDTKPIEYSGEVVQLDNGSWYHVEEYKAYQAFMKECELNALRWGRI